MNHNNDAWSNYFMNYSFPIREIIQDPNWQPTPTTDGSIALTRAEHLEMLDPDGAAALARNPTLAAKVRHNITIETAAVQNANPGINLPPHPLSEFLPENASQRPYRINLPSTVGPGGVDEGASDPEIYSDRADLANGFILEQCHPAEYQQYIVAFTQVGGLEYTTEQRQLWYQVGKQKAMARDADFARKMRHNTQLIS